MKESLFTRIVENDNYKFVLAIIAVITFIGTWIYCIATYGFLLGVGLGWLPSLIVACIAGILWPLIGIVLGLGIVVWAVWAGNLAELIVLALIIYVPFWGRKR